MYDQSKKLAFIGTIMFICLVNSCGKPTAPLPQAPDIFWMKTYGGTAGEGGYSLQQTSDGEFVIVGYTESFGSGGSDVYLVKLDANYGVVLWMKTYGGANNDYGYSVQQTSDGGYIIAGKTESFGAGNYDLYVVKTDVSGNIVWAKTYGGTDADLGSSIQKTSDCGYIIVGYTESFGTGYGDVYLVKINEFGDSLWARTYGGIDNDCGYSVRQTSDGGYIIAGITESFGAGGCDVCLIRTDANGDTLWRSTYGGISDDHCNSVQQTSDGCYIVAGTTCSGDSGGHDVYLMKTNVSGGVLWTRTYGGMFDDRGYSVQETSEGGFIIAGTTCSFGIGRNDVYLIKTNASGDTLWARTYGGTLDDHGYSVQQTTDGGYIVVGDTESFGAGANDVYIIKTEP